MGTVGQGAIALGASLLYPDPGTAPLPLPAGPPRTPRPPKKAPAGFPGDECEKHHRLPEQFKAWFEAAPRNLNIENYTQSMPMQWHRGQGIGLHSQGYNPAWQQFIAKNPGATAEETLSFLNQLERGIGFGPLAP